jgi:hypothetical protein
MPDFFPDKFDKPYFTLMGEETRKKIKLFL